MREAFKKIQKSPAYSGLLLFLAALLLYFALQFVQDPGSFFTIRTYRSFAGLFKNYAPLILVTMGQALLMLMGIIDISIGVQLSFANVLAVMLPEWTGMPVAAAWALTLCASVLLNTVNGLVVSYLRIPPLLAGYAMIYIVKGINLAIRPAPGGNVPAEINLFYDKMWGGVLPTSVIILTLCYLGWVFLARTPLMRHVYAVGGSERNAFATGIDSARTKVKMYALAGLLTGIGGLCYTAAYSTGNPITGEIYGLQSISACILGGISLAGGWGTMPCALFGIGFQVLIQTAVPRIFSMLPGNYNTYWHNLASDAIILIGLIGTIFAVKAQRTTFAAGLKKQVKGGGAKDER